MIMNKDTAVHTCNARNKTFRKMQYIKQHIKAENVLNTKKQSAMKQTLHSATHKLYHNVNIIEYFCFVIQVLNNFHIFCHGTPQRDVP